MFRVGKCYSFLLLNVRVSEKRYHGRNLHVVKVIL